MKLTKNILFVIAGTLWTIAGIMVIKTGVQALIEAHPWWTIPAAAAVYVVFYLFVFSKLVRKHERRILDDPADKMPWWQFFDRKSYTIMIVMMTGGALLRKSGLLPTVFFSSFYTGLGLALFSCGLRFLYLRIKHKYI